MVFKPRAHKDFETLYIIGEFCPDGSHVYMAFDGCGNFGDTYAADAAERFDSVKEAKSFLKQDEDAIDWVGCHPNAKIYQMKLGYIVNPTPKGVIPIVKDRKENCFE